MLVPMIDRERERLHKIAKQRGLRDERTIRQSQKVDRLINIYMSSLSPQRNNE